MLQRFFKACLLIALVTSCKSLGGSGASGLGDISGGGNSMSAECMGDFGTSAAAARVEAFMQGAAAFESSAHGLQDFLLDTCKAMARELGTSTSGDLRSVCKAAADQLSAELRGLRANANLSIDVVTTPPVCEVSMEAYANCAAECDASVDPGGAELECEGGEIAGQCEAKCEGSCVAEVSGSCEGSCEGTCSAGCSGTCNGTCEGKCSATAKDGSCKGKCQGTCHGTCSAGCKGSCEGSCAVKGKASCDGECRGGCSVAYKEPRCTGKVKPPSASADCNASCDAKVGAEAECKPGRAEVVIQGEVGSNLEAKIARVRAAIAAGWSGLLAVKLRLERIGANGKALIKAATKVPALKVSLDAANCVKGSIDILKGALQSVTVSTEVSVSASASVSAG